MKEDVSSAQITTIIVLYAEMNIFQEMFYVLMNTFKLLLLLKKKKRKKKLHLLQQIKAQSQSRKMIQLKAIIISNYNKMKTVVIENMNKS